jgi:hypothetical protein
VAGVGQQGQGTGEDPSGGLNGHETDVQPSADGESYAEIGGGVTVPMPMIVAMMRVPMVLFMTLCGLVSPVVVTGVVVTRVISMVMVLLVRISHHP